MDRERIEGMKPHTAEALESLLRHNAASEIEEEERRMYRWIDDTIGINFWEFRKRNHALLSYFEICEDVSYSEGWKNFAEKLGLDFTNIQHCEKFCGQAGPTKAVLDRLESKKEYIGLTLKEVLAVLKDLGQHDILRRVSWQEGISKFEKVQNVPAAIKEGYEDTVPATFSLDIKRGCETLVCSANEGRVNESIIRRDSPPQACQVKILMVFASDARREALEVVEQLRNPLTSRGRVGVLLLMGDVASTVAANLRVDPHNSIHKWFKQVRFVVPVLSPQFLKQIQNRDRSNQCIEEKIYNRFVYRLTLDDYVANMSRNTKCRPLYPSCYHKEVVDSELVRGNGLLQIHWNCSSKDSVEQFAELLIDEAKYL
ncbi:uncharacterized protein LOC125045437 [Penaeus chinensis]|uniref:uncharacterized protein LOC125045437 n=1 Tax=Penaeus chinensis TaxID=139456 RepID=UPI001FB70ED1|nr:uncharacterized protein LOC125045437 [Penaeus chinensis]